MEDTLYLFLSYFPILFFAIGFIGNVLVIRIVHKTRQMHTPTNYLLANMAVSDVITILLLSCKQFTENQLGRVSHKFATFACKAFSIVGICVMVSSITLTVLALERYHALLKPFRTELRLSEDNVKKAIVFIWTTSVVICFPQFFFIEWSEEDISCVGPFDKMTEGSKIFTLLYFTIFIMQSAIMIFCYGSLIRGLYFTNTVCSENDEEGNSEKKKLVLTFLLASLAFLIGYGPFTVLCILVASGDNEQNYDSKLYSVLGDVSTFLFELTLCLNPILYAFRSSSYQQEFKRLLICKKPTPNNDIEMRMAVSDVFTIVTIAAHRFAFIPNAFSQEFDRINHVRSGCVGQRDSIINLAWKIHLIVFNALFLIQSVVMVFCYGSLIRGLYFTNTVCPENETADGERSSEKKKLVITFLLATLGFLIGYVPGVAFNIVVAFQTNANIDINLCSHLQNAFSFMFSCSLCLNPLVYGFRSAHFREGFKRVLTTCWKQTPQDDDIH
ncbi:unnamed protein product [Porites lobata]|uniref:G-protein coupled receptors family 1 profile domain-containing protein n=1 Tax=Porites lobata TaxID=104759 RepID=A0ABN8NGQ9_9CNID|nr:unnamed protein product [Porites lobata]